MIRLRDILNESIVSVTFGDIWNGVTINHGDSMSGEKSTLKTIQRDLQSKHPKYATDICALTWYKYHYFLISKWLPNMRISAFQISSK